MLPEVSPAALMMLAFGPAEPPPIMVTGCWVVVISRSPVAAAFAAMMAPRKLQSKGATVQAVAAAVSSVRSTSNVVAKTGMKGAVFRIAGAVPDRSLFEFEDAVCVNCREAQIKTTSMSEDQVIFFAIVGLPLE